MPVVVADFGGLDLDSFCSHSTCCCPESIVAWTVQFADPAAVAITWKFAVDLVLLRRMSSCPTMVSALRRLSNVVGFFGIVLVVERDQRVRRFVAPSASLWCTSADVWFFVSLGVRDGSRRA